MDYNYYLNGELIDEFLSFLSDDTFLSIILLFFGFFLIFVLIFSLIVSLGNYKILKKAGKRGWEAFIPVYSKVVLCDSIGISHWWILILFIAGLLSTTSPVLAILVFGLNIYFNVIYSISLARSFGKSDVFALGIFFLSPIFLLILGFSSAEFIGKKGYDPMLGNFFNKMENNNNENNNFNNNYQNNNSGVQSRYCKYCGNPVHEGDIYCTNCGNKIN